MTPILVINALRTGGAEKQILLLSRGLAEAGYSPVLFTLSTAPERSAQIQTLLQEATRSGVSLHEPTRLESLCGVNLLRLYRTVSSAGALPVLWSWGTRADLICKSMFRGRKNLVFFCSLRDANLARIRKMRSLERFQHRRVSRYVSNSWLNCDYLSQFVPDVLSRSRVIYNSLTSAELAIPPVALPAQVTRLRVLMLGNIVPHKKGYDQVVELAARIKGRNLPIQLQIAGRDDARGWMQRTISARALNDVLLYQGAARSPHQFLGSGDAFLLMSRAEGTPNALLEAMNIGLPCIATKVGDVPRFTTDGKNVRLVEVGDIEAVCAILESWLADWGSARRIGAAGRELCGERFAPQQMMKDTNAILSEFSSEPGERDPGILSRSRDIA